MASFNKVILLGYIVVTPILKTSKSGAFVTSFRIGVGRRVIKDDSPKTDYFDIVCWRQTAEFVTRNFSKGNAILVCGSLQTRSWVDEKI